MPTPGVDVSVVLSSVTSSGDIPSTAHYCMVTLADRGPTDRYVPITSLKQFEDVFGGRVTYGWGWDDARVFFDQAGGGVINVVRVVGPAAVKATATVASTFSVTAVGAGQSMNGWKFVIATGSISGFKATLTDANNIVLEGGSGAFDNLADTDALVAAPWSLVTVAKLGATTLVAGTSTLASGADDRASVTGTHMANALALFTGDLVGGVVAIPGYAPNTVAGSSTIAAALATHAGQFDRIAYLGMAAASTLTSAQTAAGTARTDAGANAPLVGQVFHPWITVASGAVRYNVPPTGFAAARRAVAHRRFGANTAPAGPIGAASPGIVVGVETAYDETSGQTANSTGVNIIRVVDGAVTIYGYRSLSTIARWQFLNVADQRNTVVAALRALGRKRLFATIDGRGYLLAQWKGEAIAFFSGLAEKGQIFPTVDDKGYFVNVGPSINTPAILANNEIRMAASYRPSPTAEHVQVDVSVALVNGPL